MRNAVEVRRDHLDTARMPKALEEPSINGRWPQRADARNHMADLQALLQADLIADERILIPAHAHVFILKQHLGRMPFADEVFGQHEKIDFAAAQGLPGLILIAEQLDRDAGRLRLE